MRSVQRATTAAWLLLLSTSAILTSLACAAAAHAQEAAATAIATPPLIATPDPTQALYVALITGLTPMVIALVKYFAPRVPKTALPIIAPLVGAVVSMLGSLTTGTNVSVIVAALAGLAGVGAREAYDQLMQLGRAADPAAAQKPGG